MAGIDFIHQNGVDYEIAPEIAPRFKTTVNYAAGDCVIYNAEAYRFKTAHQAGAWIGTDAEKFLVGEELGAIKEELTDMPTNVTPVEDDADLYICDENGDVILELKDGHIKTKKFDSANSNPFMDAPTGTAELYICDAFGNVLSKYSNGNFETKNFKSADFANVLTDIEDLQTDVGTLQTKTSGILYRLKDQIDGVYASCRWHQPSASDKQFCILIAGDIHGHSEEMESIIDYFNAVDAFDMGVMLGDMSSGTSASDLSYYTDAISRVNKPWLTVVGNHDVYGITSDSALYARYMEPNIQYAQLASGELVEGKCYYYKDFASAKIRTIVLMQYEQFDGNLCFGQNQIDWLIATLDSTPTDYGVVILEHTNPSRYMTYEMDLAYTSSTWSRYNYAPTDMDGDPVPDIVNAWINGDTLTKTYAYTYENAPSDLSVSADFTERGEGEFITYLGGHWHMDVLGHPTDYADQPDYHVPAAGLASAVQGDIPRRASTISEDSFCAIGIDRSKKTVKVFHIGAHYTKDAIDRQYFKYSYGGTS